MPNVLWRFVLARSHPEKWSRDEWKELKDEEIKQMYRGGLSFRERHKDKCQEVSILSEGYRLVGEYYDFGGKGCAIFLGGRCDTLVYTAFYAEPYVRAGYNILIVDWRSHGLSEGTRFGAGIAEIPDSMSWIRFAHDVLNNEKIVLHGICIGGQSWLLCAAREDFPSYVEAVITDGLYLSFYRMFISHIWSSHQFPWPCMFILRAMLIHRNGIDIKKQSVEYLGAKIKVPVLAIVGKEDKYVPNKDTERAIEGLGSAKKKMVYLPYGAHSHFRLRNSEAYDQAVLEFLKEVEDAQ
ncbi:MAG: alpha/beta hydrolase [Bacilli bacterium]|nr:alpha/beta hydrolase [Bacilli bacterium]